MRVTKSDLEAAARRISRLTGKEHYIERSYSRPRLFVRFGQGCKEVSPRLPSGELLTWMEAYQQGIEAGLQRQGEIDEPHLESIRRIRVSTGDLYTLCPQRDQAQAQQIIWGRLCSIGKQVWGDDWPLV